MLKTVGNPSTRYGDQTIVDGDLIIATAGKGIDFSSNPNAPGMTSELLDWYEEGTWTPAQGPEVTVVGTYSSSATYTRIGRQVTVNVRLMGSTSISCTAFGRMITDLPYTVAAGVDSVGSMWVEGVASAQVALASQTTTIVYATAAFGAPATIIEFTLTYFV